MPCMIAGRCERECECTCTSQSSASQPASQDWGFWLWIDWPLGQSLALGQLESQASWQTYPCRMHLTRPVSKLSQQLAIRACLRHSSGVCKGVFRRGSLNFLPHGARLAIGRSAYCAHDTLMPCSLPGPGGGNFCIIRLLLHDTGTSSLPAVSRD